MTQFTIYGEPKGKARARTFYNPKLGRSQSITPENTVLYENLVKQSFLESENRETFFDKEPLRMTIIAYFKIPNNLRIREREAIMNGEKRPTKKPDADNIAKVICDALNGIAYGDDTQIVELFVYKRYAEKIPKVTVSISKVEVKENEKP